MSADFRCPFSPQVVSRKIAGPKLNLTCPVIIGVPRARTVNGMIRSLLDQMIRSQGYPGEGDVSISGGYKVHLNQSCLLSLSLDVLSYIEHAAHPMTVIKSLTFDVLTGRVLKLRDLFIPGSGWVAEINRQIKEQIASREIQLINPFETIGDDQDYYLTPEDLVIYFQLYEYTPYAFGFPEFPIPLESLRPFIEPFSPLARLLPS